MFGDSAKGELIPKGTRSVFRDDPAQPSERSDAGCLIVEEPIGFVKTKSGAQRRKNTANEEGGSEKGRQVPSPPRRIVAPEREQRSGLKSKFRLCDDSRMNHKNPANLALRLTRLSAGLHLRTCFQVIYSVDLNKCPEPTSASSS